MAGPIDRHIIDKTMQTSLGLLHVRYDPQAQTASLDLNGHHIEAAAREGGKLSVNGVSDPAGRSAAGMTLIAETAEYAKGGFEQFEMQRLAQTADTLGKSTPPRGGGQTRA